jgi:hypothetical protein
VPASAGQTIKIGGADVLTYRDMLLTYAEIRKLRRLLLTVPFAVPRLSAFWVHLVTPVPASIALPMIVGFNRSRVDLDRRACTLFPDISPLDYRTAVRFALTRLDAGGVETSWKDALTSTLGSDTVVMLTVHEGMLIEHRRKNVPVSPAAVFQSFTRIGGDYGWHYMNWAWEVRGAMDRLIGGVGLRRGRRDPHQLRVGDALDFWRVEAVEPDHLLRLRAEMIVPGDAWLQFEATPRDGGTHFEQTAFFAPRGLAGYLYWYVLYPIHGLIFSGMLRRLARQAEALPPPEKTVTPSG